jgi:hypothetical protein
VGLFRRRSASIAEDVQELQAAFVVLRTEVDAVRAESPGVTHNGVLVPHRPADVGDAAPVGVRDAIGGATGEWAPGSTGPRPDSLDAPALDTSLAELKDLVASTSLKADGHDDRLGTIESHIAMIDTRLVELSTVLTNQLGELGLEIDSLGIKVNEVAASQARSPIPPPPKLPPKLFVLDDLDDDDESDGLDHSSNGNGAHAGSNGYTGELITEVPLATPSLLPGQPFPAPTLADLVAEAPMLTDDDDDEPESVDPAVLEAMRENQQRIAVEQARFAVAMRDELTSIAEEMRRPTA